MLRAWSTKSYPLRLFSLVVWLEAASLTCGSSGQVANGSPPIVPLLEDSSPMDAQSKTSFTNQEQMSQLASPSTATQEAVPPPPSYQTPQIPPETKREKAEKQLKQEEKQRILAVLPAFNTSYVPDAVPLSPTQKFRLAFRTSTDYFMFVAAGADAALSQATNNFSGYGQGWAGYGKRFGASYLDNFDGTMIGNALFPMLLRQDPRYFRMGTGSLKRRFLHAISYAIWCKNDNGKWGPNYSNVLGNLAAGGISNLYYPSADRGAGLAIARGFTVSAEGTIGGLADEFWPDVARKFLNGRFSKLQGHIPDSTSNPQPPEPPKQPK